MASQIHWAEGLFLQQHHLQRAQRVAAEQIRADRRLGWPFPWGLVEMRVSRDELENFRLRFDRLRAIMPSGLEVNVPEDTDLPTIDIRQALSRGSGSIDVRLAVPLWHPERANLPPAGQATDSRSKYIYSVTEKQVVDENTGESPVALQFRRVNARLLIGNEDTADLETLPLLKLARAGGEETGLPRENAEFVPPCMVLGGSPVLKELVRDLSAQVEASRKELVNRLAGTGFMIEQAQLSSLEPLLRLRTLNRFAASLPSLVNSANLPPFVYYLELRELLGELTALYPARDAFDVPEYDHDNPYPIFYEIATRIRELVRGTVVAPYEKVPFHEADGKPVATLTDAQFTKPTAWLLGIQSRLDPQALANYVIDADRFKLMPLSLGDRAIRGIELKWEPVPPPGLPTPSGLTYFRLQHTTSARARAVAQQDHALTIRWRTQELDWTGVQFTLYLMLSGSK